MRISDQDIKWTIHNILDGREVNVRIAADALLDLQEARKENQKLKTINAELAKCIEDLRGGV